MHFVNWNHSLYKSPEEASRSNENDGLLVLAKFVKIGEFNPEFDKLAKCMHEIHLKNQKIPVDHINISNLLSSSYLIFNIIEAKIMIYKNNCQENLKDYWTYFGSLTT